MPWKPRIRKKRFTWQPGELIVERNPDKPPPQVTVPEERPYTGNDRKKAPGE